MCCPFVTSLASFGVCEQGSQQLLLQQLQGSFAGPHQGTAGIICFTAVICCPCKISQSYLRTALMWESLPWEWGQEDGRGTGGGEGEQGSIPVVHVSRCGGSRWGKGGGIVYCAKGKQRGLSAGAYWHKPRQWLWASPPPVSDGLNRPLPCSVGSGADRLLVEGWILLRELARGQKCRILSLPSGDGHCRKAKTSKLGASSLRSHLWILLKSSCWWSK